ncbi:SNARE protein [Cryptosporidium parvum]|nr:SNARE protein [Cryptosporidium sp. 43IA8]
MRAYSIIICNENDESSVKILSSCYCLSRNFYFYCKIHYSKGVQEIITHDEYTIFSYKWSDGLSISMICDDDFPARIAFSSIFEAYMNIKDKNQHELSLLDDKLIYRTIFTILNKYKEPLISDAITESQIKIDKAREAINVSLKSFLDRGENLDELIQKSNDLSDSSKKLFKMSKKTKRPCCSLQ